MCTVTAPRMQSSVCTSWSTKQSDKFLTTHGDVRIHPNYQIFETFTNSEMAKNIFLFCCTKTVFKRLCFKKRFHRKHWLNRPKRYAAGTHSGQINFYRRWNLTWKYIHQTCGRFVAKVDVWQTMSTIEIRQSFFTENSVKSYCFCFSVSTPSLRLQRRYGSRVSIFVLCIACVPYFMWIYIPYHIQYISDTVQRCREERKAYKIENTKQRPQHTVETFVWS